MPRPSPGEAGARIDSLIATEKNQEITVEARGAVMGGGWKHAVLRPTHSGPADAHVLVLEFVAAPPSPDEAVVPGLVPVAAAIKIKARKGLVSVRAVGDERSRPTKWKTTQNLGD